jgi:hypothetical protein
MLSSFQEMDMNNAQGVDIDRFTEHYLMGCIWMEFVISQLTTYTQQFPSPAALGSIFIFHDVHTTIFMHIIVSGCGTKASQFVTVAPAKWKHSNPNSSINNRK